MKNLFNKRLRNIALILLAFIGILLAASGTIEGVGAALTMAFAIPASIAGGFTVKSIEEYNKLTDEEKKDYAAKKQKYDLELQKALIEDAESKDKQIKELMESNKAITEKLQRGVSETKKNNFNFEKFKTYAKEFLTSEKAQLPTKIYETEASEIFNKAAITMTTANTTLGVGVMQPLHDNTINNIPRVAFKIMNYITMQAMPADKNWKTLTWNEQDGKENGAYFVPENGQKPKSSITYKIGTANVKKIANIAVCSTELIQDAEYIWMNLKDEVNYAILQLVEQTILTGDGVDGWKGITGYAKTLTYAPAANSLADPTMFDVLLTAITQIYAIGKGNPNVIILNESDWLKLMTAIDANGNKLDLNYVKIIGNDITIAGIPVIVHSLMTSDKFAVADASKYNFIYKQQMEESIANQNNNDWEYNRIAYKRELRAVGYVKGNDENCFVSDTFTNGITFLKTV